MEYLVETLWGDSDQDFTDQLNSYAKGGWRLVATEINKEKVVHARMTCVFEQYPCIKEPNLSLLTDKEFEEKVIETVRRAL